MSNVSIIKNHSQVVENMTLLEILKVIKSESFKEVITEIRQLIKLGSIQAASELKKTLLGFTTTGIFDKKRKTENFVAYSGMLMLDLDHLMPNEMNHVQDIINSIPYTYASFVSPSGLGIKVVIKVDSDAEMHKEAYAQVKEYYEGETGKQFDSTSDLARLCYFSYDPSAFFNQTPVIYNVLISNNVKQKTVKEIAQNKSSDSMELTFANALKFTEERQSFRKGNRNNFIFLLAGTCKRFKLPVTFVLDRILDRYSENFDEIEIRTIITNLYNKSDNHFSPLKRVSNFQEEINENEESELKVESPEISLSLIDKMPYVIKKMALMFSNPRERDVFILGMLSVLGGSMTSVSGIYDGDSIYPSVFIFVIAPAASGKGKMKIARHIGEALHDKMIEDSKKRSEEYAAELEAYNQSKKNGDTVIEKPTPPPFKMLFVPANSSSAAIYEHLRDTNGMGIVFETEADTLNSTMKNDWANYSDLLRKAFHHETLSSKRKTNKEYIEIKRPKLSIALSGTSDQVARLIQSAENGLFSRFIFYKFEGVRQWRDVSPANGKHLFPNTIKELGEEFLLMIEFLENHPTNFNLTERQWNDLNNAFDNELSKTACFVKEELAASVIRFGIITFRLAMIFSAIKKFEDKVTVESIVCTDEYFYLALDLVKLFLVHTKLVFESLGEENQTLDPKLQKLFDALPLEFERKEAVEIAKNIGYRASDSTVDKYLKRLITYAYLEKDTIKYNCYRKIKTQKLYKDNICKIVSNDIEKQKVA